MENFLPFFVIAIMLAMTITMMRSGRKVPPPPRWQVALAAIGAFAVAIMVFFVLSSARH